MHLNSFRNFFFKSSDPNRIYQWNYWTYVYGGFWAYESDNRWKTYLFKIYQSLLTFTYIFAVFSFLTDAVVVRNDLEKLSFNMSISALAVMTFSKVILMGIRINKVKNLLSNLDNNLHVKTVGDSAEDKEILRKRARLLQIITRLLYALLFMCFTLRMLADTTFETKSYLIPLPFDVNLEGHYEIIYAQQVILGMHFTVMVISHDLFIYGMINRLIAHIEILQKNIVSIGKLYPTVSYENFLTGHIQNFKQTHNDLKLYSKGEAMGIYRIYCGPDKKMLETIEKKARRMLKESAYHHQQLINGVLDFLKIYGEAFVIQAVGAVFIIGLIALEILLLSNRITPLLIQQILYVGISLVNNLFLCSFGTELTSKSVAAAHSLYDTPWYDMGAENKKILAIINKKLMLGLKLKGGGLVTINRSSYLKFLKMSYNIVVVLRNVYNS